ncbi:hypothetical protein V2J52_04035 [Georgenia sp. MJ173]|uniref:hypothetical protein n=1 Tax=Georgenia sunbinii TaxID=3117728 RepID=UPI002F267F3E
MNETRGTSGVEAALQLAADAIAQGDAAAIEKHMLAAWDLLALPKVEDEYGGTLAVDLTELYRDLGRPAEARRWLAVAREVYGPDPDPHTEFLAGTVHYAAGEIDAALAVFNGLYTRWNTRPFHEEPPQYLAAVLAHRAGEPVAVEPVVGPFTRLRADAPRTDPAAADPYPQDAMDRVEELCDLGDVQAEADDYRGAVATWTEALALLPEPRTEWGEATWLYASLGDAHFQLGDDAAAQAALFDALGSPDGAATGYVHYMLGVSMLRTDDARAVDHLLRAYALEGKDIFEDDGETGAAALRTIEQLI